MLIEKDCVVGIHVRMFDLQKNLLEETEPQGVTYLHGHGDIFPKLEQALEGKKAGETVVVQLEPDEAFGDFDDEAIRLVPVESLGDPELIVPGLVFSSVPGETPDGRNWRVTDVAEGMAVRSEMCIRDRIKPDVYNLLMGNARPGFASDTQ